MSAKTITLTDSNTSQEFNCSGSGSLSFQFTGGSWNSGTITVQGLLDENDTDGWEDLTGGVYSEDGQDVIDKWYGLIRFVASGITSVNIQVSTPG